MKRIALAGVVVAAAMFLSVPPGEAFHRRGAEVDVFFGVGPAYRYAPQSYYVYSGPAVLRPAPIIVPSPVYVAPPPPPPAAFWYYCPAYDAYYPSVPACPHPWLPVPAR